MERRNFSQILREANVDIQREYDRLYNFFYVQKITDARGNGFSMRDYCAANFMNMPFRKTCVSLDDFDDFYKFSYEKVPSNFDINYLVLFCEYTYNLVIYTPIMGAFGYIDGRNPSQIYIQQVLNVIEAIGYMSAQDEDVTIFVPKSAAAISVAEIVEPVLSYKVIEYNHHKLKGNLVEKKNILLCLYEKLEPQRPKLKQINKTLEDNIFTLFNNLNLRHNNCDERKKEYYKDFVAKMLEEDLESWYDEIYQICLLAFLELDNIDRNEKVKELKVNLREDGNSDEL